MHGHHNVMRKPAKISFRLGSARKARGRCAEGARKGGPPTSTNPPSLLCDSP